MWGWVLWSPLLSLHCTYAITEEEMPTAASSVNEITKAVGRKELTVSLMAWNQSLRYLHSSLKLNQDTFECEAAGGMVYTTQRGRRDEDVRARKVYSLAAGNIRAATSAALTYRYVLIQNIWHGFRGFIAQFSSWSATKETVKPNFKVKQHIWYSSSFR